MFEVEYKGGNGIIISAKKTTVVIDPKLSSLGLKDLNIKDMVEIATESRFSSGDNASILAIEGPGEYEIGDFSIRGIAATRHIDSNDTEKLATIYRIEVGNVRIALLGNIASKLDDDQLESLGVVDIAVLPVGGGGLTPDATSAASLVRQLDPKAVIPVHYADAALTYEMPQDTLETFTKELGAPVEVVSKYKVKSVTVLPEALTVIQITRS